MDNDFKGKFLKSNLGSKYIMIALVIMVFSLFLPWADIGFFSANGFQKKGFLFLVVYIYPFIKAYKGEAIKWSKASMLGSLLSIFIGVLIYMDNTIEWFYSEINISGSGLFVFMFSASILTVGIFKYSKDYRGE